MSNLQVRIISAVVLAAAVLLLTWLGGLPFRILAAVIALAIFHEWTGITRPPNAKGWGEGKLGFLPEICMLVFVLALVLHLPGIWLALMVVVIVAGLAAAAESGGTGQFGRWEVAGVAYASLSGLALAGLRDSDRPGLNAILFLFAVVWATDILAYFVGRAVGGPKLAPSISPGKTRSGALGGAVGGVVAGMLLGASVGASGLIALGAIALMLSVVAQAGDLFESWVKRRHGVKDSGWIIPGHGGVMDRVDGLVAAALALYVIGCIQAGFDHPARGIMP